MATRSPGRPHATTPKDVRVTVRLSAHEADLLQRLARDGSLSQAVRACIRWYIDVSGGAQRLPDTPQALIRRELRKAKHAAHPDAAALEQLFTLDEAAPGEPQPVEETTIKHLVHPVTGETMAVPVTTVTHPARTIVPTVIHRPEAEPVRTISVPITRTYHCGLCRTEIPESRAKERRACARCEERWAKPA